MLTRENKKEKEKTKSVQQKNTEGKNKNPLNVRSKSLGTKNDLSYSRSSDLRIHAGRKREKKAKKVYKSKTNKQKKKNKDTSIFLDFFLLLYFSPNPFRMNYIRFISIICRATTINR